MDHEIAITIYPETTIKQVKDIIRGLHFDIRTAKLYFNNGEQLSPVVFETDNYDNVNFGAHTTTLPGSRLVVRILQPPPPLPYVINLNQGGISVTINIDPNSTLYNDLLHYLDDDANVDYGDPTVMKIFSSYIATEMLNTTYQDVEFNRDHGEGAWEFYMGHVESAEEMRPSLLLQAIGH